jgi:dolichol kinase/phosphoserine phosphatase
VESLKADQGPLIVFDVEGILLPRVRFLLFEVFGRLGLRRFLVTMFHGFLYTVGLISLKAAMKKIFSLLEGLPYTRFIEFFDRVPIMPGVEELFEELRKLDCTVALISSGIPNSALEKLATRFDIEYFFGPEIGVSRGKLTGEIWGQLLEKGGKRIILERLRSQKELKKLSCIAVADDRNNISLFQACDIGIGYDPDYLLTLKADYVVKGNIGEILSIIKDNSLERSNNISRSLLIRKLLHALGIVIPLFLVRYLSHSTIINIIILISLIYLVSETYRMFKIRIPLISDITLLAAGDYERHEFVVSPITYSTGIILALGLFPDMIGYAIIGILTLGDSASAFIGRKFGRTLLPFNKNKTLEGSIAGFLAAFLGATLFLNPVHSLIASLIGMAIEAVPSPINDNITIPLSSGLILLLLGAQ